MICRTTFRFYLIMIIKRSELQATLAGKIRKKQINPPPQGATGPHIENH